MGDSIATLVTVTSFMAEAGFLEAAAQLMTFAPRIDGQDEGLFDATLQARYGPENRTRIMRACRTGDVSSLRRCLYNSKGSLREGAAEAIEIVDTNNYDAFHHAVLGGAPDALNLLIEAGGDFFRYVRHKPRWPFSNRLPGAFSNRLPGAALELAATSVSLGSGSCFTVLCKATAARTAAHPRGAANTLSRALHRVCSMAGRQDAQPMLEMRARDLVDTLISAGFAARLPTSKERSHRPYNPLLAASKGPWSSLVSALLAAGANPFAQYYNDYEEHPGDGHLDPLLVEILEDGGVPLVDALPPAFKPLLDAMVASKAAGTATWLDGFPVTDAAYLQVMHSAFMSVCARSDLRTALEAWESAKLLLPVVGDVALVAIQMDPCDRSAVCEAATWNPALLSFILEGAPDDGALRRLLRCTYPTGAESTGDLLCAAAEAGQVECLALVLAAMRKLGEMAMETSVSQDGMRRVAPKCVQSLEAALIAAISVYHSPGMGQSRMIDIATALLDAGASPSARVEDDDGIMFDFALHRAVWRCPKLVVLLLERGADPWVVYKWDGVNRLALTPLVNAACYREVETFTTLLSAMRASIGDSREKHDLLRAQLGLALTEACRPPSTRERLDVESHEMAAKAEFACAIIRQSAAGPISPLGLYAALQCASQWSDVLVRVLLEEGASVSEPAAVRNEMVPDWFETGNPDVWHPVPDWFDTQRPDTFGHMAQAGRANDISPLQYASGKDNLASVATLIAAGADVNGECRVSNTPLHTAAFAGNEACVRLLLAAGASHAATNINGSTPLHCAVLYDGRVAPCDAEAAPATVLALVDAGADPFATDAGGRTPLDRLEGVMGDLHIDADAVRDILLSAMQ